MNIIEKKQEYSDLIQNILYNNGVRDFNKYLYPTPSDNTNVLMLPNVSKGIELIKKHINNKILLLVDADADGVTSSAIMYKYLKHIKPDVDLEYFIHPKKAHGLTNDFMNCVLDVSPQLVIVLDAGTNDIEQREQLFANNIDILIIDHHNEDRHTDKGGVLINNHANYPRNSINKNLTGATMTYLFCKALDKLIYKTGYIDELDDIAMIGTVGDCALLSENEVRYLCMNAIKNIKCQFLKHVVESSNKNIYDLNLIDLQFNGIISLINSVIRVGSVEEKEVIFKALSDIDTDKQFVFEKKTLNKYVRKYEVETIECNLYQYAIEVAQSCKFRQDKIIRKELERANMFYEESQGVQIYILDNIDAKPITGLIANQLANKWGQPTIVVHKTNDLYTGSLRGNTKSMSNFKQWCEETGLFEMVQGHNNAAGVIFKADNYYKILSAAQNVVSSTAYHVEKLYNNRVELRDIYLIDENSKLFKNGISTPLFGIKNIAIKDCNFAWSKNTLRIKHGGVTYVKFQTDESVMHDLRRFNQLDVVGSFQINNWNNNKYPQIIINDMEGYN